MRPRFKPLRKKTTDDSPFSLALFFLAIAEICIWLFSPSEAALAQEYFSREISNHGSLCLRELQAPLLAHRERLQFGLLLVAAAEKRSFRFEKQQVYDRHTKNSAERLASKRSPSSQSIADPRALTSDPRSCAHLQKGVFSDLGLQQGREPAKAANLA